MLKTTLQQCENLTVDLLQKKLDINIIEAKELLSILEEAYAIVPKYTFQCRKCGEMNTFTEDMIRQENICQLCGCGIDINKYKQGATVRYILNQNNFWEYLEEEGIEIQEEDSSSNGDKGNLIYFEQSKENINVQQLRESENMYNVKKTQLFISHATKDIKYIQCFVKFLEELGFNEDNMFCSSIDGYGIKWGEDIYDYLRQQFTNCNNELVVLFMLSKNYYDSAACLNEMGAAWVLKKEYRSILLPGFDFEDLAGAIDPRKIAIKLDDENLMLKLNDVKKQLLEAFGLNDISPVKWDKVRNELINGIKRIITEENE